LILIGLDKIDEALAELAHAEEERWYYLVYWRVDHYFDRLRSDPRFKALMKKAGLEK
jgi:hypothetical protein